MRFPIAKQLFPAITYQHDTDFSQLEYLEDGVYKI